MPGCIHLQPVVVLLMLQLPDLQLPDLQLPERPFSGLPEGWSYFSNLQDGLFLVIVLILIGLLITWWRQQSTHWFRIVVSMLLFALILSIGSFYLFVVTPYEVGCNGMCTGWRGFPRPVALITIDERSWVGPVDFGANAALLWLIWLTLAMMWRILTISIEWAGRGLRTKILIIALFWVLPWALLPRFLSPPQPTVSGEDLRLANNALRAAEFTYNITGLWVQRLALEDIRTTNRLQLLSEDDASPAANSTINVQGGNISNIDRTGSINTGNVNSADNSSATVISTLSAKQICLRGYTYFYLPWGRYRLVLEASGVSSVQMVQMPLSGSCWP